MKTIGVEEGLSPRTTLAVGSDLVGASSASSPYHTEIVAPAG